MDIMDLLRTAPGLEEELRAGLELYWRHASTILQNSGVILAAPQPAYYELRHNFFSALFLLSFQRAGLPPARRVRYAAVNQCLRGMVTGCDNILDNEYKMTLDTDIPGTRFRSVMDIMVSDRVLFDLLLDLHEAEDTSLTAVRAAHAASLQALARSGVQEASEEEGVATMLEPERILSEIHHLKTGLLFQCVWAVPRAVESRLAPEADMLAQALYDIGMGCQILDDMVDLKLDLVTRRHNYVAALIVHEAADRTAAYNDLNSTSAPQALLERYPSARRKATVKAVTYLKHGLHGLLGAAAEPLVPAAITFLVRRIGAQDLLTPGWQV